MIRPWTSRRELLALMAAASAAPAFAQTPTAVVSTAAGPVRGRTVDGVNVFKGLRYAAPPLVERRFLPPQPLVPWTAVADAVEVGSPAVQMYTRPSGEPSSALGKSLLTVFPTVAETQQGREDCLFLNVWTPGLGDGKKRPVMVWVHGGGYAYGSGAWPAWDGRFLARRGAVVVTVNHRLNAFGYLHLADAFGEAYAKSGNAGQLDLVAALEWVRDNAEAFGGDPKNVTLFGQSGGGAKVATLLAMPAAKGLFHKAIIQSGPSLKGLPKDVAARSAELLLTELGIGKGEAERLQKASGADIVRAAYAAQAKAQAAGTRFALAPVVDGAALPRDPFAPDAPAQAAEIPLIIGTNKDEQALFMASQPWFGRLTEAELIERARQTPKGEAVLAALRAARPDYSPTYLLTALQTATSFWGDSIALAERKVAQGAAPVFFYRMDWETPIGGGVYRAGHSVEVPLVFDTVDLTRDFMGPGPEPKLVAAQMSAAWLAFAQSGNPNAPGVPQWPAYDLARRQTMIFDVKSQVVSDPEAEVRKALAQS